MTGWQVAEGRQVNHHGTLYRSGQPLPADLPADLADHWHRAGWIAEAAALQANQPDRARPPEPEPASTP